MGLNGIFMDINGIDSQSAQWWTYPINIIICGYVTGLNGISNQQTNMIFGEYHDHENGLTKKTNRIHMDIPVKLGID